MLIRIVAIVFLHQVCWDLNKLKRMGNSTFMVLCIHITICAYSELRSKLFCKEILALSITTFSTKTYIDYLILEHPLKNNFPISVHMFQLYARNVGSSFRNIRHGLEVLELAAWCMRDNDSMFTSTQNILAIKRIADTDVVRKTKSSDNTLIWQSLLATALFCKTWNLS